MKHEGTPILSQPLPYASPATLPDRSPGVPALEVHDLTVSYHRKPVLWNVDLAVPPGKVVGILGPNGAG